MDQRPTPFRPGRPSPYPEVVVAGGCSGHAFKFVPVIGKILADLAVDGKTAYSIALFDPARAGSFDEP